MTKFSKNCRFFVEPELFHRLRLQLKSPALAGSGSTTLPLKTSFLSSVRDMFEEDEGSPVAGGSGVGRRQRSPGPARRRIESDSEGTGKLWKLHFYQCDLHLFNSFINASKIFI